MRWAGYNKLYSYIYAMTYKRKGNTLNKYIHVYMGGSKKNFHFFFFYYHENIV